MMKVQLFSCIQQQLPLFPAENFALFKSRFLASELGKIYQSIPWSALVSAMGLKNNRKGRAQLFPPQGRLALMFLKNYSGLSDSRLIEQLNGNLEWQFFCGIYLGFSRIDNFKIVSQIRCELSSKMDIDKLEKILYDYWQPHISEPEKMVVDATCYESGVRYPTDVKLLWECVEWCNRRMIKVSSMLCQPRLRTKYLKWARRYVSYSKMRKKRKVRRDALRRSSLALIHKLLAFLDQHKDKLSVAELKKLATIHQVYSQQHAFFHEGIKPTDRIVSLDKPYVRPIVRGKEIKPVEFGAKVNKVQIDGISFIEHISFDAFHEGNRFKQSVYKIQSLTRKKIKVVGADAIYATNANRNFVSRWGIKTDFKAKGRRPKDYKEAQKLKGMITKERASRLEGSFGKDKEHYHLRKIKARTQANEILWIFFGIHTSNALEIGRRISAVDIAAAA